jgi:hypothetical protein
MKIRSNGIPITDRLIACKGRILRDQIDPSVNCKFSNGWLENFKKRHNIISRKGGAKIIRKEDCSFDTIIEFVKSINNEIKSDIYLSVINIDEIGVLYDPQINFTLDIKGTIRVEIKNTNMAKQRITVILGIDFKHNIVMKPFIIFKGKTTKCLKGIMLSDKYDLSYQKNSWCTSEQFILFLKTLPRNEKILLIYDNFRGHLTQTITDFLGVEYPLVKVITLPPNTTPILQPLDVGINKPFKEHIKNKYIEWLIKYYDKNESHPKISKLERNNLIAEWIKESWMKVCDETIINKSFNFCGYGTDSDNPKWQKFYRI